jgi:hypothetical protein
VRTILHPASAHPIDLFCRFNRTCSGNASDRSRESSNTMRHPRRGRRLATAVRDEWIRQGHTQLVVELKLAIDYRNKALTILRDDRSTHWSAAAQPFEDAHQTLYRMDRSELAQALQHANLAHAEIAEHRPTRGGGSVRT